MQQRHTLRASKTHADTRTARRRDRGADERAEVAEHLDDVPMCACGRDYVGNLGTHCLQCELEPFGIAWQHEQDGRL